MWRGRMRGRNKRPVAVLTPAQAAAVVLAKYPGNASVWLPGNSLNSSGTTATVGQNVQTLQDSGSGNNVGIQTTTAAQPTLVSQNGMNAWFWNGGQSMPLNHACWASNDDAFTLVGAATTTQVAGSGEYIINPSQAGPAGALAYGGSGVVAIWGGDTPTFTPADARTPIVLGALKRTNNIYLRSNGVVKASGTTTISGTVGGAGYIGAYGTNVNDIGYIWCALAIKGTVTDSDALTLERWFNTMTPTGTSF